MKLIWILLVFYVPDGQWRAWKHFDRESECWEVVQLITHQHNDIYARCEVTEDPASSK